MTRGNGIFSKRMLAINFYFESKVQSFLEMKGDRGGTLLECAELIYVKSTEHE